MRWLYVLVLVLFPQLAAAQGIATLVADSLRIEDQNRLIAQGNIEVLYDGTRLSAAQITYDRAADQLTIFGPIFLRTADGEVLTATRATLDPQLENGILRSARLMLDDQLQLAATELRRVDGRYTQLQRAVASSCNICEGQAPLWDIRAHRVVHDRQEQQLYFENATFRVRGIPIAWLPYLRLPDPTLDRATGFLIPRVRTSDLLGLGIKLPYFITIGDHRDLTLTPYISSETRTLEAIYRQAFFNGDIEITGAFSSDDIREEDRAYIFADGTFEITQGTTLSFGFQDVTDDGYLREYNYADIDRLESFVAVENITENRLTRGELSYFETLRDDESNGALPPIVADLRYEKREELSAGTLTYGASADAAIRTTNEDGFSGRNVTRLGGFASLRRPLTLPHGVQGALTAGGRADLYRVTDDATFERVSARFVPTVEATLRWPLIAQSAQNTQMITPILSLAWSDSYGPTPPNEDSTRAELDQANLFALSRFPADDRVETGVRAAFGVNYARTSNTGNFSSLTFGRVVRTGTNADFSPSSGLDGSKSDWLVAGQVTSPFGIHVDARALFDDALDLTLGAGRLGWRTDNARLTAAYIWQDSDATENRPEVVSEWSFDTTVRLNEAFAFSADARYDVAANEAARAGFGLRWRNECVTVDLSVSRRFTSSDDIEPSTDYGISAEINGFSTGRSQRGPVAGCTN